MNQEEFNLYFIHQILDQKINLKRFNRLIFRGEDVESFLQGQLTCDISEVKRRNLLKDFTLVDLKGCVLFRGAIGFDQAKNEFFAFIHHQRTEDFLHTLNKYIITEDVMMTVENKNLQFTFVKSGNLIAEFFLYPGMKGFISEIEDLNEPELLDSDLDLLTIFLGHFIFSTKLEKDEESFLPSRFFHDDSVSFEKGCFKGQELLAKINNNRKAANKDWLLQVPSNEFENQTIDQVLYEQKEFKVNHHYKFNDSIILELQMPRELRSHQLKKTFKFNGLSVEGELLSFPILQDKSLWTRQLSEALFLKLSDLYIKNYDVEDLILMNQMCIELFPLKEEFYESIAQFLKKSNRFHEAIEWMDHLTKLNPDNVLAYTNRSLLYMNLGEIEKAEEEKAKGVAIEFRLKGKNLDEKKEIEKLKQAEKDKRNKQKQMFAQVLQIDEKDLFANLQMSRISRLEENYDEVEKYLEALKDKINQDPEVVLEYALYYKYKNNRQKLEELVSLGIPMANQKGNTKVATQLQNLI